MGLLAPMAMTEKYPMLLGVIKLLIKVEKGFLKSLLTLLAFTLY